MQMLKIRCETARRYRVALRESVGTLADDLLTRCKSVGEIYFLLRQIIEINLRYDKNLRISKIKIKNNLSRLYYRNDIFSR